MNNVEFCEDVSVSTKRFSLRLNIEILIIRAGDSTEYPEQYISSDSTSRARISGSTRRISSHTEWHWVLMVRHTEREVLVMVVLTHHRCYMITQLPSNCIVRSYYCRTFEGFDGTFIIWVYMRMDYRDRRIACSLILSSRRRLSQACWRWYTKNHNEGDDWCI